METPSVTPTSIAGRIDIKKVGHVVNATIAVTPTASSFANVATGFPKAPFTVRTTGIVSSGAMASSFLTVETTGLVRVCASNADINKSLLFSITYITED